MASKRTITQHNNKLNLLHIHPQTTLLNVQHSHQQPEPDTARLLDSIVLESGNDVDGEGIDFVFDESTWGFDFSRYQIVAFNVIPSNHDVPLYIRVSTDGGSTYDVGAMREYNVNCITAELENEVDAPGYSLARNVLYKLNVNYNYRNNYNL